MGWSIPTVLSSSGTYNINQVETNNQIYRIDYNYPSNEYLLIENRQRAGTETCLDQGGLIVFHIDDNHNYNTQGYPGQSGWPGNGNHYRVAVLQADGNYNLEKGNNRGDAGDAYHGASALLDGSTVPSTDAYQGGNVYATDNQIHSISASGSSMSFFYDNLVTPPDAPSGLAVGAATSHTLTLSWTDNSSNESNFEIERADGGTGNFAYLTTVGSNVHGLYRYQPAPYDVLPRISQVSSIFSAARRRFCYKNHEVVAYMERRIWHTRWVNRNRGAFGSFLTVD